MPGVWSPKTGRRCRFLFDGGRTPEARPTVARPIRDRCDLGQQGIPADRKGVLARELEGWHTMLELLLPLDRSDTLKAAELIFADSIALGIVQHPKAIPEFSRFARVPCHNDCLLPAAVGP